MTTAEQITVEYRPLGSIVPAIRNPKGHDHDGIRASLVRHGFVEPLIEDGRSGQLVGGHGRLEVLVGMMLDGDPPPRRITVDDDGMWHVPVVVGYGSDNEQEAEALLIGLNRLTEAGGIIDPAQLAEMLTSLDDLAGVGFSDDEVLALLAEISDLTATTATAAPTPAEDRAAYDGSGVRQILLSFPVDEFPGIVAAFARARQALGVQSNTDVVRRWLADHANG